MLQTHAEITGDLGLDNLAIINSRPCTRTNMQSPPSLDHRKRKDSLNPFRRAMNRVDLMSQEQQKGRYKVKESAKNATTTFE
jgi:hypothetical protein